MLVLFLGMIFAVCGNVCAMDPAQAGNKQKSDDEWAKEFLSKALERKKQQQEENEKELIVHARQQSKLKQLSPQEQLESEKVLAYWESKIDSLNRTRNKKQ